MTLRRRLMLAVLPVMAVLALLPGVRLELRRSFTRLPTEYTELYFPRSPTVTNAVIQVPVSLVHHGAAPYTYAVKIAVAAVPGTAEPVTASTAVRARPDEVAGTTFEFAPPAAATGLLITVTLADHPQSLHYRLYVKDVKDTP
ncbi:hypothetical protein [Paractinoplanes durhamensis]|uniref:DUF1616 domain-containing protein n=1 Tax=Paractinoplanes durhamensis TaxID=113563 RepID=A0ABQ3Z9X1_9ACTN|nr:hypothetical protein [Actinoplanes durhamensis]GIE06633.1 hypothetical protein Adu01nite_79830 [Actinoplanes durhamensis]